MAKTALLLDPVFKKHDTGPGHPESAARYRAITEALNKRGVPEKCLKIDLRNATDSEILGCHTAQYLDTVRKDISEGKKELSTGDTNVCKESYKVALQAAGSVLNAIDNVFDKKCNNAFCAVRPPGHHASADRGMGFCIFNNVAVAARYAQSKHGAENVAIIDWDVHHGNGTQDIFYNDGSVFYFSTHQSPWYPGTGAHNETGNAKGEGATMNRPMPAGSGFKELGPFFSEDFMKAMKEFKPDLILISAGFDSRLGDPLGHFRLTDENFTELTKVLLDVAHKYSDGRLVSILEGGYNIDGLGDAVESHVSQLIKA
ncbi:histone deacetylase [Verrucomicrobiales bacterium]|nr:histone deacetylase [Verrucomicrobiales bacterium]